MVTRGTLIRSNSRMSTAIILFMVLWFSSGAAVGDIWTSSRNESSGRLEFRDSSGYLRLEFDDPGFMVAKRFDIIMAVVDGKELLIDTHNRVLAENFKYAPMLNFFSIRIMEQPSVDAARASYLGVDGRYYTFIDYKKEFTLWLQNDLLKNLSRQTLKDACFDEIHYWIEPRGWTRANAKEWVEMYYESVKASLAQITKTDAEFFESMDGLNQFIYEDEIYAPYFNHCSQPKEWQYPVIHLVISHKYKEDFYQDHLDFLRTAKGYKLIGAAIRNSKAQSSGTMFQQESMGNEH